MIWLASYPRSGNSFLATKLRENGFSVGTVYNKPEGVASQGMFMKTHENEAKGKAVHLIRHPLDICCSMVPYLGKPFEICVIQMSKWFGGLEQHWDFWKDRKQTVLVKYEDLYFSRIKIAEIASKLKAKPDMKPLPVLPFEELKRQNRDGARLDRGKPKRYKDELNEAQKVYFKNRYGRLLEEMKYEIE